MSIRNLGNRSRQNCWKSAILYFPGVYRHNSHVLGTVLNICFWSLNSWKVSSQVRLSFWTLKKREDDEMWHSKTFCLDRFSLANLFVRATIGVKDHQVELAGRVDKERCSGDRAQAAPQLWKRHPTRVTSIILRRTISAKLRCLKNKHVKDKAVAVPDRYLHLRSITVRFKEFLPKGVPPLDDRDLQTMEEASPVVWWSWKTLGLVRRWGRLLGKFIIRNMSISSCAFELMLLHFDWMSFIKKCNFDQIFLKII